MCCKRQLFGIVHSDAALQSASVPPNEDHARRAAAGLCGACTGPEAGGFSFLSQAARSQTIQGAGRFRAREGVSGRKIHRLAVHAGKRGS
jgi:hypothetical protein